MQCRIARVDCSITNSIIGDIHNGIIIGVLAETQAIQPVKIAGAIGAGLVNIEAAGQHLALHFIQQFPFQLLVYPKHIRPGGNGGDVGQPHFGDDVLKIANDLPI